jgi:hypothetical protein
MGSRYGLKRLSQETPEKRASLAEMISARKINGVI